MPKFAAYLVTVGTEPGVYDEWPECAARVIKVEGSIYKGYRTKVEALDAYRAALAEGRVKVVPSDRPAPVQGVPAGAQIPPPRNPSNVSTPSIRSARTSISAAQLPQLHAQPARSTSRLAEIRAALAAPATVWSPPTAAPVSSTVQSPRQAPVSRSSSSPNVVQREHDPSPRRRVQSTAQSPVGHAARSSAAAPRSPPTSSSTRVEPTRARSTWTARSSRPPTTTAIPPPPTILVPVGDAGSDAETDVSGSSPLTNVTYIEPDFPSHDGSRPTTVSHSSASPNATPRSTRSRMREGVQYANSSVQATPAPSPRARTQSARTPSTGPSVPASIKSSPARRAGSGNGSGSVIARSQSESAAEMHHRLLLSPRSSPRTPVSSSSTVPSSEIRRLLLSARSSSNSRSPMPPPPTSPSAPPTSSYSRRSARPASVMRSGHAESASAPLSPLALGLSQPLLTPGVVYPASADPRSPIQRATAVPSSSPVFHRPSPPSISLTSALFGA
ncbi:uncharacterized protein C8Q71DRAFT_749069 [Rhodofomes roseus]|uniref:Ribonuclease H1 N-terminal domain-containing protein n=1 Tax=Rhodofomes roseus TaxID=34475 RepID=A0ABQ8KMK9_9APHY|nr:uncharacterized protein C8Q71DRAFT_749069 [Rhodofomes roseus]KAH9839349.1 hypothetical protein C8Q71DRAFT_749069 [Rhodofomes roseus]